MPEDSTESNQRGVVVVQFELSDPNYPFVGLSVEENCHVALQKMLPRGPGEYAEYFSIFGAEPDRVLKLAEESNLVSPNLLARYNNGGLFEFLVKGFCPARDLAKRGAIPREVVGERGTGHISAEILPSVEESNLIDKFLEDHPTAELRSKEQKDRLAPLFTQEELQMSIDERLTERQQEVLETAFEVGYYDPTKGTTGDELGDKLGISPATVSQHLKAAERKLVTILLEERM